MPLALRSFCSSHLAAHARWKSPRGLADGTDPDSDGRQDPSAQVTAVICGPEMDCRRNRSGCPLPRTLGPRLGANVRRQWRSPGHRGLARAWGDPLSVLQAAWLVRVRLGMAGRSGWVAP